MRVQLCVAVLSESLCAVAVTLTVFGGWRRCGVHVTRRVSATQRTPTSRAEDTQGGRSGRWWTFETGRLRHACL